MRWWMLGLAVCAACETTTSGKGSLTPVLPGPPTVAGTTGAVQVQVQTSDGQTGVGTLVQFSVALGGGKVAHPIATNLHGIATVDWTLGPAPILQRLKATAEGATVDLDVTATLPQPWTTETWGDVEAVLKDVPGSTEDLAFGPGGLVMGKPGGLLQVDAQGHATAKVLTGDAIEGPLGLAYDAHGTLWVADNKGHALRKVAKDGTVATVAAVTVQMPNDVAVDAKGRVWITDTCGGTLQRYDPALDKVDATVKFDGAKDGGPNGVTVDAQGSVWMTTENTVLFCKVPGEIEDPVASLFRIDLDAQGQPKAPVAVLSHFAFSGDGLTFDGEGNLYVIFDQEKDFALTESTVYVLAKGSTTPVRFLTATDRTFANVVFGKDSYGATQLYLSLVAVPPFTTLRGLQRFDAGVTGP